MLSNNSGIRSMFRRQLRMVATQSVLLNSLQGVNNILQANCLSIAVVEASNGNMLQMIDRIALLFMGVVGCYLAYVFFDVTKSRRLAKETQVCKNDFLNRLLSKQIRDINSISLGSATENLYDDIDTCVDYYTSLLPNTICSIAKVSFYAIYVGIMSPMIALIFITISSIQIVSPIIVNRFMATYYNQTRDVEAEITEQIVEAYDGLDEIKRNDAKDWILTRFIELHKRAYKVDIKNQKLMQAEYSIDNLSSSIMTCGTYAILGFLVLRTKVSLDVALQAVVLSDAFYGSIKVVLDSIPQIGVAKLAFQRLSPWYVEKSKAPNEQDSAFQYNHRSTNVLSFVDCSIRHIASSPLLFSHLSISLELDQISILLGDNGSGKSTLLQQIAGWKTPESGAIRARGIELNELSDERREKIMFYLPQEAPKLQISAISLFEEYDPSKVDDCIAYARQFGLNMTELTSDISSLSGGERKKVFLALAFSTASDIYLLLDEPTNFLDGNGVDTLVYLLQKRGSGLIVSHDPRITDLPYRQYIVKDGDVYEKAVS